MQLKITPESLFVEYGKDSPSVLIDISDYDSFDNMQNDIAETFESVFMIDDPEFCVVECVHYDYYAKDGDDVLIVGLDESYTTFDSAFFDFLNLDENEKNICSEFMAAFGLGLDDALKHQSHNFHFRGHNLSDDDIGEDCMANCCIDIPDYFSRFFNYAALGAEIRETEYTESDNGYLFYKKDYW